MVQAVSQKLRRRAPNVAIVQTRPRLTVVDDSAEFVALLADIFAEQFEVTATSHASVNSIADTRPDLLIIDDNPASGVGLTASEVVGLARHHRRLRGVPVIVCTTDYISLESDARRFAEYENVQLMAKPFAIDVLESLVDRLVPTIAARRHRRS